MKIEGDFFWLRLMRHMREEDNTGCEHNFEMILIDWSQGIHVIYECKKCGRLKCEERGL
jgi:hypothetical protein